jgi:hypothetical protein
MEKLLTIRELIYDQFHHSNAGETHFFKPENADVYAAYYTSMYLIQDTGEAILEHIETDFSENPLRAYLEFWGVMQATIIQQDAIRELHKAVIGDEPLIKQLSAWQALRDKRNLCAGHPANRSQHMPSPQRTFMGRNFGTYRNIQYELWDANAGETTHPQFDLGTLLHDYDAEASQLLGAVLDHMKMRWPVSKSP